MALSDTSSMTSARVGRAWMVPAMSWTVRPGGDRRLRGVVSVRVVTGRFDLIRVVLLEEGFDLLEFYTEEVSRLEGVQSLETFVVYKSYNLKIPYIY